MAYWTFLDFVNDRSRNGVQEWIASLNRGVRKAVKAELNARIDHLAQVATLDRPYTGQLRGAYAGLYEIIMCVQRVQYRPLWCYGPSQGEITILTGAIEKDGEMPSSDCDRAMSRKELAMSNRRYVCEHDFS